MIHKKIQIWKEDYEGINPSKATLTTYVQDNYEKIDINRKRPAILICPGGGYSNVSDREAEPVALYFLSAGYNVFVLKYDLSFKVMHPSPLFDVSRAMWIIRKNAAEWNTDYDKIAVCGFSAGGHLAASLGVFWNEDYISKEIGMPKGINKPNALILSYPVITSGEHAHRGSFNKLIGEDAKEDMLEMMSLEKQVSKDTPSTFIWHTYTDKSVPVENSLFFAAALRQNDIPFELHVFDKGVHGLSLCNAQTATALEPNHIDTHVATWAELCVQWLRRMWE